MRRTLYFVSDEDESEEDVDELDAEESSERTDAWRSLIWLLSFVLSFGVCIIVHCFCMSSMSLVLSWASRPLFLILRMVSRALTSSARLDSWNRIWR